MAEQPLHVAVLQTLERRIVERREQHKEAMSKGLSEREYAHTCGRAAECKTLMELLEQMLTAIRNDELDVDDEGSDDADIENRNAGGRRTKARKPRG